MDFDEDSRLGSTDREWCDNALGIRFEVATGFGQLEGGTGNEQSKLIELAGENEAMRRKLKGHLSTIQEKNRKIAELEAELRRVKSLLEESFHISRFIADQFKVKYGSESATAHSIGDPMDQKTDHSNHPANDKMKDIGYGLFVSKEVLEELEKQDINTVILNLLELLFSKEEFATRSVTGKGRDGKGREALNQIKLRAIAEYVVRMQPGPLSKDEVMNLVKRVKTSAKDKCSNERKKNK